ncbi:MAG: hypothetical protein Q4C54_00620 [Clostridia bacterium]|nr:hypothetical protein [Clostridia bacterium]
MSVLHLRQLEACESRLSGLPDFDLFALQDDSRAEQLWSISHAAQEFPRERRLHTVSMLRDMVIENLPVETALVTLPEHLLLEKLIVGGGRAELTDMEDALPAESLVRRLWCYLEWVDDERLFLRMSP